MEFFVRKFIRNLPDRRRDIFLCSFDEGLTYKEIALKLSISENTVDTQIRNALEYLRENILKYFGTK
jgi:RNA polymerase sigma-70 factor (ECF subfamily)